MVMANRGDSALQGGDVRDDVGAASRVLLDDLELLPRERGRLREDRIRHADLADVVEERCGPEQLEALRRQAELAAEKQRHRADTVRVAGGVRVFRLDGRVQCLDRFERALLE